MLERVSLRYPLLFIHLLFLIFSAASQQVKNDGVMMQAFYWDVPVDAAEKNGNWWDHLRSKAVELKKAGITALWLPSPAKGNWGIYDMGYGVYDHYDLGNYFQKGSVETRFGSRGELQRMIVEMHRQKIQVYADMVMNHIYTNDENEEINPAVKEYVFGEAGNGKFTAYPTNEIKWVLPAATPGEYFVQVKGYNLDWNAPDSTRGYDIVVSWGRNAETNSSHWEIEPNDGLGKFNEISGPGQSYSGFIQSVLDKDEYKISLNQQADIIIKLTAKKGSNLNWQFADQRNGYYPFAIWHKGKNLISTLQAKTNTGIRYVKHRGRGEKNYKWDYSFFHPVNNKDWLGGESGDGVITNSKLFGNDVNTFDPEVQQRYRDWGKWLLQEIKFDGYRLDFVRGYQESFVSSWVESLPKKNNQQPFVVAEYWGGKAATRQWVNKVNAGKADVKIFDFPLKVTLTQMCNSDANAFDMRWLNHAGMIRDNTGQALPAASVVTFAENHDTGKEYDKWITKDIAMAYAYILTHEGRPCVYYNHFFITELQDMQHPHKKVEPPVSLRQEIENLVKIRNTYLEGDLIVLSETGNPMPAEGAKQVYVARRNGKNKTGGAIIVINNDDKEKKGLWVTTAVPGFENWAGKKLVNLLTPAETLSVEADGRAFFAAPPRGYSIWVKSNN